ncbi:MAG: hypothetical protein GXN94_04375 [Aquificae bacterium]|nr:hypothetical protein [Aquificota bacterium]
MKRIFRWAFLVFFIASSLPAKGYQIGIKEPQLVNLPEGYRQVIFNFFTGYYKNTVPYREGLSYDYTVQPFLSSIAGSYNLCLDVYEKNSLKEIICFSAPDGEKLADRLYRLPEKTELFKLKRQINTKPAYLKVYAPVKNFEKKLKVISRNGDLLVDYKKALNFNGQKGEGIVIKNGIINIDTVILKSPDASHLFEKLLDGYRIKGILIIKTD